MYQLYFILLLTIANFLLGSFSFLTSTIIVIVLSILNLSNGKGFRQNLNKVLEKIFSKKDVPLIKKITNEEYGYNVLLTVPAGVSTDDLQKDKKAIEQYTNSKIDITYSNGLMKLKVLTNQLKRKIEFEKTKGESENLFFIGHSAEKKEFLDWNAIPHLLVAGATQNGKTKSSKAALLNDLICWPDEHEYIIGDFKVSEFDTFKKCRQVLKFFTDFEETEEVLDYILNEMDSRYKLFAQKNIEPHIVNYNKKFGGMKRLIIFIDEFADIAAEKDLMAKLTKILRKGGAAGINCILCTQKPTADSCPTSLKANMLGRLAFQTANGIDSKTILDETGAEDIDPDIKGRALFKVGTIKEVQCMYIPKNIERVLSPFYVYKKPNIKNDSDEVKNYDND